MVLFISHQAGKARGGKEHIYAMFLYHALELVLLSLSLPPSLHSSLFWSGEGRAARESQSALSSSPERKNKQTEAAKILQSLRSTRWLIYMCMICACARNAPPPPPPLPRCCRRRRLLLCRLRASKSKKHSPTFK